MVQVELHNFSTKFLHFWNKRDYACSARSAYMCYNNYDDQAPLAFCFIHKLRIVKPLRMLLMLSKQMHPKLQKIWRVVQMLQTRLTN